MPNHKWKDESFSKHKKEDCCIKCGVFRSWQYGDMQCWKYWWPKKHEIDMVKTQFERPECK